MRESRDEAEAIGRAIMHELIEIKLKHGEVLTDREHAVQASAIRKQREVFAAEQLEEAEAASIVRAAIVRQVPIRLDGRSEVMAKKRWALIPSEREKECTKHLAAWTGEIPLTGQFVCRLCGTLCEPPAFPRLTKDHQLLAGRLGHHPRGGK